MERGKPENPEKNPRSRDEKQQQTQPTYDAGSGNRTRATLVGGERPHHCTMPANLRDLHERREGGQQGAAGTYFDDLDELGRAYELESRRPRITINRPFQVGITLYQLTKLRSLEFYYDFLGQYFHRSDFELIQIDTDCNFPAISADRLEDIVRPKLRAEFEAKKKEWLVWEKWTGRTQGLFKLKCEGSRMIALCSKCYYVDEQDSEKRGSSRRACRRDRIRSPGNVSKRL